MFLSFIVPVYNTEKYLGECLDSLLAQDIPPDDYEIICVNDGSTDRGLELLLKYASSHKNLRIVDKENEGVATARNIGLGLANGQYIWFIDSDDMLQSDALAHVYDALSSAQCDRLIVGNYAVTEKIPAADERAQLPQNRPYHDSVVWRSILRTTFLRENNLRFNYPDLILGEDCIFIHELLVSQPKTMTLSEPLYFYRSRPGSAMTSFDAEKQVRKLKNYIQAARIMQKHYQEDTNEKRNAANLLMHFLWNALHILSNMPQEDVATYFNELRECGLYPYNNPPECDLTKSYATTRTDIIGKLFDKIYINMHHPWGFHAMYCLQRVIKLKHKISDLRKRRNT